MIKCRECQIEIKKDQMRCSQCGLPKSISGMKVEDSNVANARKPAEMPTIMGHGEFIKSAMCPCCNLLMYIKDTECPHCGYLLTEIERQRQHHYSWKQRLKGYKLGGVFTIFFILLFMFLFAK